MTNFSYNRDIPDGPHNPSVDQPNMKINTNATDDIWNADHIGFNLTNGGLHKQVSIPSIVTAPALPSGLSSIIFTLAGVADATASRLSYATSKAYTPLNLIKAFATFNSAGAIISSQQVNVTSVTRTVAGNYNVVLVANAVTSTAFGVNVSCGLNSGAMIANYTITGIGTFTINTATYQNASADATVTFTVYQL